MKTPQIDWNPPDADRYIPAADAMIAGWNGPILLPMPSSRRLACFTWCGSPVNDCEGVLDPMRPEVRDHLIRRLSLPQWMRDGAGLEPGGPRIWSRA